MVNSLLTSRRFAFSILLFFWPTCAYMCAAGDGYVGSKVCYGCHTAIYNSFVTTAMGQSMRPAAVLEKLNVPLTASVPAATPGQTLKVLHDESGWHQSEELPGVFVDEHKLDYIVGSGVNGLTFIVRRGDGLFQAPLSYYSKTANWDLSPGYQHLDLGFSRPIAQECIGCHSGRARPIPGRAGDFEDPPFQELAIGCENCHGPGATHAANPKTKASIINPAKLTPRLAEEICLNCHQGGDARVLQPGKTFLDFRPGEWLLKTDAIFKIPPKPQDAAEADLLEHNSAMKVSRCFIATKGGLSCLTCHNPHEQPQPAEAAAYFKAKCLTCHSDKSCGLPLERRAQSSPPDDCIGCHMPKRNVATIAHSALTNHRIPARLDEPMPNKPVTQDLLVNQIAGQAQAVPDVTLLRAYGELSNRDPSYGERYLTLLKQMAASNPSNPLVQAGLGHNALAEGDNTGALEHLTKALPLREPTVYVDMAKALSNLGRDSEAVDYLKQAGAMEPYDFTVLKMTILQDIKLKNYSEARDLMQKYVALLPEDSFMRDLLARVSR